MAPIIKENSFFLQFKNHILNYLVQHDMDNVPSGLYDRIIKEVDCSIIEAVLGYTNNNRMKAAKILGISRTTLLKKIEQKQHVK